MEREAADHEARRQRKRENDRKAQRLSRERTRKRIEHLEFVLGNIGKNAQQEDSAALAERVEQVTREKDELLNSLRSIESLVQRHISRHADSSSNDLLPTTDDDSEEKPAIPPTPLSSTPASTGSQGGSLPPFTAQPFLGYSHQRAFHKKNKWETVKSILRRPENLSKDEVDAEHSQCQDVVVRAVLEGWEAVEEAGNMSSLWAMLRQLDELCFSSCGIIERLAIMRIMHLLLMYHADPTPRRFESIPVYYWMRPSQIIPHPYPVDFFPWPGLRERLVFSEDRYAGPNFSELFSPNFKLYWPYDLQSVYTRDTVDGKFSFSPLFDRHIRDLQVWTMGPDVFCKFPELMADIPVYNSIPNIICGNLDPEESRPPRGGPDSMA